MTEFSESSQLNFCSIVAFAFRRTRALFVLTKIDEILAWERRKEAEKDTHFVDLGRYLCEVLARQYWRAEKLVSFRRLSGEEEGILPQYPFTSTYRQSQA